MRLIQAFFLIVLSVGFLTGCRPIEETFFPVHPPAPFVEPPAPLGPHAVQQTRIITDDAVDGQPLGITVYTPAGVNEPLPVLVWVLGVNARAYYHQSFHEYMASWGYAAVVPDTRDLRFTDLAYHRKNMQNALLAFDLARLGELGFTPDDNRMAFGGYGIGGTLAAFATAMEPRAKACALWAPAPAPIWQGIKPSRVLPLLTQPCFYLLAELDTIAPANGWPAEIQNLAPRSHATVEVIPQGVHSYFQQPGKTESAAGITRTEQQSVAFEKTRAYLDEKFSQRSTLILRSADR